VIAEGKIIEAWEEYDELGMRRQLGVLPEMARGVEEHVEPAVAPSLRPLSATFIAG
jgi:hypothetical protein